MRGGAVIRHEMVGGGQQPGQRNVVDQALVASVNYFTEARGHNSKLVVAGAADLKYII